MAKKKSVIKETLVTADVDSSNTLEISPAFNPRGKAVGSYYDEKLKRYIMVTLDFDPETGVGEIISKETLRTSKIGTIMKIRIKLEQLMEEVLK